MTRKVALAGLVSALAYALVLLVISTSDSDNSPVLVTLGVLAGVSWIVAALIALGRYPEYRTGWLMLAAGLLWSISGLQLSSVPLLFTIGVALGETAFAPWIQLTLGFPEGRLRERVDRALVTTTYVALIAFPTFTALFDPTPLSSCDGCPNSLVIADRPDAVRVAVAVGAVVGALLSAIYVVRLVRRYQAATPPLRRILGPIYVATVGALVAIIATNVATLTSDRASRIAGGITILLFGAVPIAFLAGLLRTHLARGSVAELLGNVREGQSLRDALAEALGDPSLTIVYPVDSRWVDEEGHDAEQVISGPGCRLTPVEIDGELVAGLVHDASLAHDPRLLAGVAGGAALALRAQGLQAETRAQYTFLRTLVETAPSLFIHVGTDGRVHNQNAAAVEAAGYDDEELIRGRYFWDVFIDPAEREDVIARFRALAPTFETGEYENEFTNAKGERRVIFWRSAPVQAENGDVVGIISGGVDITDRRERELELQRERDINDTVLDSIPSIVIVLGKDGRIRDRDDDDPRVGGNRAFRRTFRWRDEDLVGRPFLDLVAEDDDGRAARAVAVAAQGGLSDEVESEFHRGDGTLRTFIWWAVPVADVTARRDGLVLVSGVDITERRRLELEKEREREFLNAIANNARSLLCLIDGDGRVTKRGANMTFEETLEIDPESVGGQLFWEHFVDPDDSEAVREAIEEAVAGEPPRERDSTWVTGSGRRLEVAWSCTRLPALDERELFLITGLDVTARKSMEEEVRASRARIVSAADDARRRLERDLHDGAQQRLVALSVMLGLAESRLGAPENGAGSILADARTELAQALEELRELARGIHPAILTDRGLGPALEALVGRATLPTELEVPDDPLPADVESAVYFVAAEALTNVVKYAHATKASVRVTVEDGTATVSVCDDGIGGADASRGSGLRGLFDRVASLDGTLAVESPVGGGTCVRAELPVATPARN